MISSLCVCCDETCVESRIKKKTEGRSRKSVGRIIWPHRILGRKLANPTVCSLPNGCAVYACLCRPFIFLFGWLFPIFLWNAKNKNAEYTHSVSLSWAIYSPTACASLMLSVYLCNICERSTSRIEKRGGGGLRASARQQTTTTTTTKRIGWQRQAVYIEEPHTWLKRAKCHAL